MPVLLEGYTWMSELDLWLNTPYLAVALSSIGLQRSRYIIMMITDNEQNNIMETLRRCIYVYLIAFSLYRSGKALMCNTIILLIQYSCKCF